MAAKKDTTKTKTTAKKTVKKESKLPIISVITTFWNAEKFILNAVNSVNQQIIEKDKFDFEYVIVDDKSPDNSRKMLEDYIKVNVSEENKPKWKIYEPNENLGCGGARKYGIDHAIGDYFMFLDADDYYMHTNFLVTAFNTITEEKADIVEFGVMFNQPNGQQINNTASQKFVIENNPGLAEIVLFKDNLIKFNVWSKIYTREIVESYPYSTTRTYEDVRTIPVWVSNAKKIIIMPSTEINYRAATGSIIRSDMVQTRLGTITAIAELFPRFKSDYNVLKAMYGRAMVDLEALLHNHSSNDDGFNEMSKLNTYMLSFLYPSQYQEFTYNIENDQEAKDQAKRIKDLQENQEIPEQKQESANDEMKIED
jgi:glycosyltransferase involved in cell wall biosynthesis